MEGKHTKDIIYEVRVAKNSTCFGWEVIGSAVKVPSLSAVYPSLFPPCYYKMLVSVEA